MGEWWKSNKVFESFISSFQGSIVENRRSRSKVKPRSNWRRKVKCKWFQCNDPNSLDGDHCCRNRCRWSCNSRSSDNMDPKKVGQMRSYKVTLNDNAWIILIIETEKRELNVWYWAKISNCCTIQSATQSAKPHSIPQSAKNCTAQCARQRAHHFEDLAWW